MAKQDKIRKFTHKKNSYSVILPNNKIRRESDGVFAKTYRESIKNGYFLEAEVEDILKQRGYDEKKVNKTKTALLKKIRTCESELYKQKDLSRPDGKDLAFKIKDLRNEYDELDAAKNELTSQCANTIAENKRFSYFAYACVLDSDHNRIWDSFEEFEEDESDLAYTAATEVLGLIYENNQVVVKGIEKQKAENKWLMDNELMDDDFNYLNSDGKKIDREGRLIDDEMNFIDTKGRKVDIFGNLINSTGQIISEKDIEKTTPKKTSTKKKTITKKKSPKSEPSSED